MAMSDTEYRQKYGDEAFARLQEAIEEVESGNFPEGCLDPTTLTLTNITREEAHERLARHAS